MRVVDGFRGLQETITQAIEAEVNLVIIAGDLFHRSHPAIGEIAWVRKQLERLYLAGIPVEIDTGNHDFANDKGKSPATAAVDDPGRNINVVIEPHKVFNPAPGLNVHMISHLGLISAERSIPEPVSGEVNIFVAHGAAQVPGHEMFACVDSPGEAVIGYDILSMPWSASLLGHYHGMGALPGFDQGDTGQAWYAGSLLRRGFSDPEGGRGWLLVTIEDDGKITIERRYVKQRAQFDLPFIDASGLTGAQVEEQIRHHLSQVEIDDAIIRQRVANCSLPIRRGVDSQALAELTSKALIWQSEFTRPDQLDFAEATEKDKAVGSLKTAGSSDLPGMFKGWFGDFAERSAIAKEIRPIVAEHSLRLLKQVSTDTESGTSEVMEDSVLVSVSEPHDEKYKDIVFLSEEETAKEHGLQGQQGAFFSGDDL
jgi:DNA repair exonuclease SbcCD nuclease subunit